MKTLTFMYLAVVHLWAVGVFGEEKCRGTTVARETPGTACEYPKELVLVSSPGGMQVDADNCDAEYNKLEWRQEPKIMYPNADPRKTYTLVNIDPDPPAYKDGEYFLHWLVSNIKGEDFLKGDLSKANHLQGYYGPAPPEGSGLHRYMFLAFEEGREGQEVENPSRRSQFELGPWLQRQEGFCGPVAGIQFRTKF